MTAIILRRRRLGRTSCRGISEQSRTGISAVRSDQRIPETDLVFRWGCTANVPTRNVVNTAEAIHRVNNKAAFRAELDRHDLCPSTWLHVSDAPPATEQHPLVVRPLRHAQGRNLHVCSDDDQVVGAVERYPEGYYISSLIRKVAEYRVFVAQGRAVWVAQKFPGNPDDVAWNVARGGRFENVRWDSWPLKAVRMSIEAFNLSGLDFGGVDVMVDDEGEGYVLEINSAPSQTSEYRQGCVAKVFDYIVQNGKAAIPLVARKGGYKKFIHPAVCDRAEVIQ